MQFSPPPRSTRSFTRRSGRSLRSGAKVAADRAPSLARAFKEFWLPPDAAGRDPADRYWADGPVKWILSEEEKKEWSVLTDSNAREAFVEQFWTARAAIPETKGRAFREEFERRVAFADANLAQDAERRGSLTDRGMVFVLLGPPTSSVRKVVRSGEAGIDESGMSRVGSQDESVAMKPGSGASAGKSGQQALRRAYYQGVEHKALSTDNTLIEIWQYGQELLPRGVPYQQVDVHYVTRKRHGNSVLQRSANALNTLGRRQEAGRGGRAAVVDRNHPQEGPWSRGPDAPR